VDDQLAGYLNDVEALTLALVIVAAVLAAVELVRSRLQSLLGWGVAALAVALLLPVLV